MNKIKLFFVLLLLVTISAFAQEKEYISYKILSGDTIESICRKFSITPYSLTKLNPDIKDGLIENTLILLPNKNYKPALDPQKGDYVKEGFLYHKVLAKENYFRLKKQFKVSKRVLRKYNISLRTGDLMAGQTIKIPVKKGMRLPSRVNTVSNSTNTKPYLVKAKETKYSIARRYGITVAQLEELNPEIVEGLQLDAIIKVPNTAEIPDPDVDFITHQVEKGETFFSLSQQFKISQEDLISLNPDLQEGLKEGMLINLPKEILLENNNNFVPNIAVNSQVNIAILLPFMSHKTIDFKEKTVDARTLDIVTDFYMGAAMAIDSLKHQGLSVSVKVFDTKNDKRELGNILKSTNFEKFDAIIGPMFIDNVAYVSQHFKNDSLAIISPVSSKDHSIFASMNTIQEAPSQEQLTNTVLSYIESNFEDQQLIIIADDLEENTERINKIMARLSAIDSLQVVALLKPEDGYIKPDLFKETILEKKENWVILVSNDNVVTADVINNIGVFPEEVQITLFALNHGNNFSKADNNSLARVHFHYPTANFVDYEQYPVKKFVKKYKSRYYADPSEYVFKGFDITYNALLRLATFQDAKMPLKAEFLMVYQPSLNI